MSELFSRAAPGEQRRGQRVKLSGILLFKTKSTKYPCFEGGTQEWFLSG